MIVRVSTLVSYCREMVYIPAGASLLARPTIFRRATRLLVLILAVETHLLVFSQTPATGALTGVALDPAGLTLQGVVIRLTTKDGSVVKSTTSDENGQFAFLLVPPGTYQIQAEKTGFKSVSLPALHVFVTETLRLQLRLGLATRFETTQVSSTPLTVQLDTAALGRVVNEHAVGGLPLVTRNFTQITGLSPGVTAGVYNAGELGSGSTALSQLGKSNDGI